MNTPFLTARGNFIFQTNDALKNTIRYIVQVALQQPEGSSVSTLLAVDAEKFARMAQRCTIIACSLFTINRKQHMTSRVIALDLDGTLLTGKKTILPASLDALARARNAGYQVIVVTGRHHVAIHPFYQALALDTPAICCNGTYLNV
ncbi:HAD hydrolase family protein [Klebsiella sp. RHBSTW-00464]|uniref:HAD hydrolase family protein n=1 Tax=Klebsiella sp. RHBSTW-00464 TaxID=2742649 RepID=UPI003FA38F93